LEDKKSKVKEQVNLDIERNLPVQRWLLSYIVKREMVSFPIRGLVKIHEVSVLLTGLPPILKYHYIED
jgi:hypothetical protein